MARGKLITIEGLDGVGKSTLIKSLPYNMPVFYEPGGTDLAELIRSFLKGFDDSIGDTAPEQASLALISELEATAPPPEILEVIGILKTGNGTLPKRTSDTRTIDEIYLFNIARSEFCSKTLWPALEANSVVLIDRFIDSTIAYQGYGHADGMTPEEVASLCARACGSLVPDLTIYLRMKEADREGRFGKRSERDAIESHGDAFFSRVSNGFNELAILHPERIKTVNANRSKALVRMDAIKLINQTMLSV